MTAKIIDLGLAKPRTRPLREARFRLPGSLREHHSSPVRSSLLAWAWTSARTCTRWVECSGKW